MSEHIVAVSTYGSQRVNDPAAKQRVSAYKIGYTGAGSAVLLELFGAKAHDVSSRRARYHYVQIDVDVTVRHGFIVLKLTDDELATAEAIARRCHRADAYLWRDDMWLEFPNSRESDYKPPVSTGPRFNPSGLRATSPSTGEKEAAVKGIVVEKSQHDPNKPPWWWISGDTHPHRESLKRHNCRWSVKRKSWYFIGAELPAAIQQLVDEHSPLTETSTSAIQTTKEPDKYVGYYPTEQPDDGLELLPDWLMEMIIDHHDPDGSKGDLKAITVFAKLFTPDADWYLWIGDYDPLEKRILCYAVLNSDLMMGEWGWQWMDELKQMRGPWGLPMERDTSFRPKSLREALADWKQERGWSDDNPTPVVKPSANGNTPGVPDEPEPETSIRVIQPPVVPEDGEMDAVQTALQSVKQQTPTSVTKSAIRPQKGLVHIPHEFCGELTGDISGSVHCFGYAIYDGTLVYLNFSGPRSGVEAIRAKLSKRQPVNLHSPDAPSIELAPDADADGNASTGRYTAFVKNIPEARYMSMILLHDRKA